MISLDLQDLGLDRGAHLLIAHALKNCQPGDRLAVRGRDAALAIHLPAWARLQGHQFVSYSSIGSDIHHHKLSKSSDPSVPNPNHPSSEYIGYLECGHSHRGRWQHAERAGRSDAKYLGAVVEHPKAHWGCSARGAMVEAGTPTFHFPLHDKIEVWTDDAARQYAQAAAAQWDPQTAIDWSTPTNLPDEVESAVVQVMTYLIENEVAALLVPARFLAKIHPHFREILQVLAIQMADEARHIEVFTRRAQLHRQDLGLSTTGGQASLKTLIDENDFALVSFLLSVLGEGSFLSLLWFLEEHAPDPLTRQIAKLTAQDEARHVAFGMSHLRRHADLDSTLRPRMAQAVQQRHQALQHTAGLNEEVFDALVLLAAGSWDPHAIAAGFDKVVALQQHMDHGRQLRLKKLGFDQTQAAELSQLHTRNFM